MLRRNVKRRTLPVSSMLHQNTKTYIKRRIFALSIIDYRPTLIVHARISIGTRAKKLSKFEGKDAAIYMHATKASHG